LANAAGRADRPGYIPSFTEVVIVMMCLYL